MNEFEQLSRTCLLLQSDLALPDPHIVMRALFQPCIVLAASEAVVSTYAGQIAISTAAMLAARSGHSVFIDTPDAPLVGYQPPMTGRSFHEAIESVSEKLIDGVKIAIGGPLMPPDIAFIFGDGTTGMGVRAKRLIYVGCSGWSGRLQEMPMQTRWAAQECPIGALAAATLVAAETFKISGRVLLPHSPRAPEFSAAFAPLKESELRLAPEDTPLVGDLGFVDIVSAGAVSNAFLYAALRIPNVRGHGRAYDRDTSDHSNRNRNTLLLGQSVERTKVELFANVAQGFTIEPIAHHFDRTELPNIAPRVVVGVDDIPTRWLLAEAGYQWMGVGATTHFKAMSSVHYPFSACAACLHPYDEAQEGPTPTVAFVSFLAGLMVAADLLREVGGAEPQLFARQTFVEALYPATIHRMSVPPIQDCPAGCSASKIKMVI